ncbi:MAG: hypothetical protein ACE5ER_01875, partial [Nitrospinaceae bacterium]
SGAVATANSLHGTTASDQVGSGGVLALSTGNYGVRSPNWDNSGIVDAGAGTFGNGATGITGPVTAANSLVGSTANDQVTSGGVRVLANGNFVVLSRNWDNGGVVNAGAATWVDGVTGLPVNGGNLINAQNSLIGANASANPAFPIDEKINETFVTRFSGESTGRIALGGDPNDPSAPFAFGAGQTVTVTSQFVERTLNKGTAVTAQASNDFTLNSPLTVNNPAGRGGDLTIQAGRSLLINASVFTDDGALTLIGNELLANGVVDADRDPGAAVITMAGGATLNTGLGALIVLLRAGTGKTNAASGDISLGGITTQGNLTVSNTGTNPGSDIGQTAGWSVGGASSFTVTGDGAIILTHPANVFTGGVTVSSGTGLVQFEAAAAAAAGGPTPAAPAADVVEGTQSTFLTDFFENPQGGC